MEVIQVLLNSMHNLLMEWLKHAEESIKQFQEQNLPSFLLSLSMELADDAKEQHRKFELTQRWLSLDVNLKLQDKSCLLRTLFSLVYEARSTVNCQLSTTSQVIAKVAGIELPHKQWLELIGSLLLDVHQLPVYVKQATLETLGYLCEEVSHDVVEQDQVNKILTAVVQGMSSSKGNLEGRLVVTRAC